MRLYQKDLWVLESVFQFSPVSSRSLASHFETSKRAAQYTLSKLLKFGLLERVGKKHTPYSIYNPPGVRNRGAGRLFRSILEELKKLGKKVWITVPLYLESLLISLLRMTGTRPRRLPTPNLEKQGLGFRQHARLKGGAGA
jgi:hypothetical protein